MGPKSHLNAKSVIAKPTQPSTSVAAIQNGSVGTVGLQGDVDAHHATAAGWAGVRRDETVQATAEGRA